MKRTNKTVLIAILMLIFLMGCEEDSEDISEISIPLSGAWTLTEMTINMDATTVRDTLLAFASPQDGVDSILVSAGSLVLATSIEYSDADPTPIGGTVTLNNDGTGNLSGLLPINWGTGCAPSVIISALGSDGSWAADTTTGTFSLDLVVDQLDIDGTFTLIGDQLEVTYVAYNSNDEGMLSSVNYMDADVAIVPSCVPVSSVTERVLKLTLN